MVSITTSPADAASSLFSAIDLANAPDPTDVPQCATTRAKMAVEAYAGPDAENDPESALRDLLTDLRHLADAVNLNFFALLDSSYQHYCKEKQG